MRANAVRCSCIAALAASAALLPGIAAAQEGSADSWGVVRDTIRSAVRPGRLASLAVAVAQHGKIVWEEGFGWADLERRAPATPNTLYSLASITKPITATALMTLVRRGSVNLRRPANDYLDRAKITGFAGSATEATVERVLSHTAGLPLHHHLYYENRSGRPDMAQTIDRYGIVVYPPGAVYNYSNLGYGILGEIIARQSGRAYEAYVHDAVFAPLGMPTAMFGTGRGLKNAAVRYDDSSRAIPYYDFDHRGASAAWVSAHELVRFGMFHLRDHLPDQRPILTDTTIAEMQRLHTPGDSAHGYGLGWSVDDDHGYRRVSHSGVMPGVSTVLNLYPAQDVAIVVLANQRSDAPDRVAREIAAIVLPRYRAALASDTGAQQSRGATFTAPENLRGEWTGTVRTYVGTIPAALEVRGDLVLVRLGGPRALWTLLNGPSVHDGVLAGTFMGAIPTPDTRGPQVIRLSLWTGDGKLRGSVTALATTANIFGLSSAAEFEKRSP